MTVTLTGTVTAQSTVVTAAYLNDEHGDPLTDQTGDPLLTGVPDLTVAPPNTASIDAKLVANSICGAVAANSICGVVAANSLVGAVR